MRRTDVLQGIRRMKFEAILDRTRSRELSQEEAGLVLGVSERTFRRWRERFEAEGAAGLYDRRLGRVSLVKTQSAVEIQCFHPFSEIPLQQYAYRYCAVACRQFDGQRWRMWF